MDKKHYYTDEKNAQIVLALLKAHGIRKIIANPGTTNIAIVGSVQNDPWFQVYSGIDERHSAYMAVGMAAESGEPVVLSCTGATASRNYLPALTEAYYRKIPVLAITSMQNLDNVGQLAPQALDRSVLPVDTAVKSVELRTVRDSHDEAVCVRKVNDAILALKRHGGGPVHINLEMGGCITFNSKTLPSFQRIDRFDADSICSAQKLPDGKIALFIGSGACSSAWSKFAAEHNVAVFADCGANYHGPNKVNSSLLCYQTGFRFNPKFSALKPDLVLSVGEVSGDYPSLGFLFGQAPIWRISPDGEVRAPFGNPAAVFEISPERFVEYYSETAKGRNSEYADLWIAANKELRSKIPDLPFSNPWMAMELSPLIPAGSVLHLGILNSLRSWNDFYPQQEVDTYSNVGGFGIDGGMSTLIGASLASPNKLCFGVFGDLAFFYDLNSLGNRYIGKNLRILFVNNGCGTEFNMYFHPGSQFESQTNDYIAAGGHFGNQSRDLVKHYTQDLGFKYLHAENKYEFREAMKEFLNPNFDKSVVFECFTNPKDESAVHHILNNLEEYHRPVSVESQMKCLVPQRFKNVIKAALGR